MSVFTRRTPKATEPDLCEFLDAQVFPGLDAEAVYDDATHHWQKENDRWRGRCPWHENHSGTAFYIDPNTMRWRCAGCDVGGHVLAYLHSRKVGRACRTVRGADFVEAARDACKLAGVNFPERELTEQEQQQARRVEARRAVLESAAEVCQAELWSERGAAALAYLRDRWKFTDDELRGLGAGLYPPDARLRRELEARHDRDDVAEAAVVMVKLVGYIVFPWKDDRGRPLTLYGTWQSRTPPVDTETGQPKPKKMALHNPQSGGKAWLHTKLSPLYLDRALDAGLKDIIVVEGLTDAALCQVRGDARVVAVVAARFSGDQVETIRRRGVASATIALDPDKAGDANVRGNVVDLLQVDITPYVAPRLPEGVDPDDFVGAVGIEAWKRHVEGRVHGLRHVARELLKQHNGGATDPDRDALLKAAVAFAAGLPLTCDPGALMYFWPELTAALGLSPEAAHAEARRHSNSNGTVPGKADGSREADDDPHRLARLVLDQHRHGGILTLRYWREEWVRWERGAYRPVGAKQLRGEVVSVVKREFDRLNALARRSKVEVGEGGKKKPPPNAQPVTTALVANVTQALASEALLPDDTDPPTWLDGDKDNAAAVDVLPCRNALVNLPALADGLGGWLTPPTPRFFSPTCLPCDFNAEAPDPTQWLAFLRQLWPDDQPSINTLREWFGYCLTPDTSQHKILMLVGPKRSGKGTIAHVLRQLVGEHNVAAPTLASLGGNFGLAPLLGKTLAAVGDARLSGRTDTATVVERLLSISGEDAQTVDRKHRSAVTTVLQTRFVLLTNELPKLTDASGALAGRLILLRMTRTFYGKEDHALKRKLTAELPGILLWAVTGWDALRRRGYFVPPDSSAECVREMEDLASPVGQFVREKCEVKEGVEVPTKDLYAAWKLWCDNQGRKEPGIEQTFGRDLRSVVPTLKTRLSRASGLPLRYYVGVTLNHETF